MSLKRKLRAATAQAFKENVENQVKVDYQILGESVYDVETHSSTRPVISSHTIYGLLTDYEAEDVLAGMASPEQQRLTLQKKDVKWVFNEHDTIKINDEDWEIDAIKAPMGDAVLIMKVHKR